MLNIMDFKERLRKRLARWPEVIFPAICQCLTTAEKTSSFK